MGTLETLRKSFAKWGGYSIPSPPLKILEFQVAVLALNRHWGNQIRHPKLYLVL